MSDVWMQKFQIDTRHQPGLAYCLIVCAWNTLVEHVSLNDVFSCTQLGQQHLQTAKQLCNLKITFLLLVSLLRGVAISSGTSWSELHIDRSIAIGHFKKPYSRARLYLLFHEVYIVWSCRCNWIIFAATRHNYTRQHRSSIKIALQEKNWWWLDIVIAIVVHRCDRWWWSCSSHQI